MDDSRSCQDPAPRPLMWILVLGCALVFIGWGTAVSAKRSLALSGNYGVAVSAPLADRSTSTGYELGLRSLVGSVLAPDALHWVMQTQEMNARGEWRVRRVDYDNAPRGRDVHWSAPLRWWLLTVAQVDHVLTGVAFPLAIERATLWAGPMMLGLCLIVLIPFVAARFGVFAAIWLVAGCFGTLPFAVHFMPGNADHHGLVEVCGLMTVLCLVMGGAGVVDASRPRETKGRAARRWFAASAGFGTLGMWVSAASMIPLLVAIGIGALAAMRGRRDSGGEPTLWRWWGAAGGAGCLLAYVMEYGPANFGWRLEVNHPLYAAAWVGGGELLCRIARTWTRARPAWRARDIAAWASAMAAVLVAPLFIVIGGPGVFLPADEFLRALHAEYIAEFQSVVGLLDGRSPDWVLLGQFLPMVALMLSCVWLMRRGISAADNAGIALSATAGILLFALASVQVRWWGLACGPAFVTVMVASSMLDRAALATRTKWAWRALGLACFLPGLVGATIANVKAGVPTESDVRQLAVRDVAHRLRLHSGPGPLVIAATPDVTTSLIHFAGARGLGTIYWENIDGLKKVAALLGASTTEAAREIIQRTGVTHVVLFSWDSSPGDFVRLHRGLSPDAPLPADAFAVTLQEGRLPSWLRPLPHRLPDHPLLSGHVVRIYEVTEERTPARVAVDAASFLVAMGRMDEAARVEPVLARFNQDLAAQTMLAVLTARRRDERAFAATMERVTALLPSAGSLALEDRLRLVAVLAIVGRVEAATRELRGSIAGCDEAALRRLPLSVLAVLMELSDALGVSFPDARLGELVRRLLPPGTQ